MLELYYTILNFIITWLYIYLYIVFINISIYFIPTNGFGTVRGAASDCVWCV
jgi:hypothetical protein